MFSNASFRAHAGTSVNVIPLKIARNRRIESFAERTYSGPLRMTHLIAKNPVTPANRRFSGLAGEISGLVDATRRASARLINVFLTATYEVWER